MSCAEPDRRRIRRRGVVGVVGRSQPTAQPDAELQPDEQNRDCAQDQRRESTTASGSPTPQPSPTPYLHRHLVFAHQPAAPVPSIFTAAGPGGPWSAGGGFDGSNAPWIASHDAQAGKAASLGAWVYTPGVVLRRSADELVDPRVGRRIQLQRMSPVRSEIGVPSPG